MSAVPRPKRPPYFTTDVEVDICPEDLEDAGWVYVGKDATNKPTPAADVLVVIRRWHDENHAESWLFCTQDPCRDLREVTR